MEFARAGANIIVHYAHSTEDAEKTASLIQQETGSKAQILQCDFSSQESVQTFPDQVWKIANEVDIWVNNAGVDLLTGDAKEYPPETKLQKVLDIDVTSTVLLSREVGSRMQTQGRGVILNIGQEFLRT